MTDQNRRMSDDFQAFLERFEKRFDEKLDRALSAQDERFDLKLKPFVDRQEVLYRTTFGGGSNDYPGLYKTVDRVVIEVKEIKEKMADEKKNRRAWRMALSVPIFGLFLKSIVEWVQSIPHK